MTEKQLHKQVCGYIKLQHHNVIFLSDMSGLRTSIGVAVQMKSLRSSRAIPDLIILHPRNGYAGLIIEIKVNVSDVYKKNGMLKTNHHILEQSEMLKRLRTLGYVAEFGIGFDDCKQIIDNYFFKKLR